VGGSFAGLGELRESHPMRLCNALRILEYLCSKDC
jgi:hypothetical protein